MYDEQRTPQIAEPLAPYCSNPAPDHPGVSGGAMEV